MLFSSRQWRLIGRLLFLLIPYSLLRLGFYFYHHSSYVSFSTPEILESFLLGMRFDLAAICLINIPLIVLAIFPKVGERLERWFFILWNAIFMIGSFIDFELFTFNGKRMSLEFFVIGGDILDQLPQLFVYYWYLNLAAVVFVAVFYFFDRKFFTAKEDKGKVWTGILLAGLSFVAIRGGLQHKSINIQSAFVQGQNELGHLVLNTPYHFLRTFKNKRLEKLKYFDEPKNIVKDLRQENDFKGIKNANVVLIILESFSQEYVEGGYTPFLSELAKKSLNFERHLANGRRSIEALPSILCGLPSLVGEPISKSSFSGNKFNCFPKILKTAGYTNHFFHAGARGTMGFEAYTLANGFDRYFSKSEYPEKNHYDGTWGIFDEPYLQYVARHLDAMTPPFLVGVFTLSSHQPYAIPEEYKGKFKKGSLEIHESIGYTDYALKKFFEAIQDKPWAKNTLFVITSDHTQKLETQKFENMVGKYRVPMLFYVPGYEFDIPANKVTQHSDIPKSVLDFVELEGEMPLTGESVFANGDGLAINDAGSSYFMIRGEKLTTLRKTHEVAGFKYDWATGKTSPGEPEEKNIKAFVQYFINGLISNNLSP